MNLRTSLCRYLSRYRNANHAFSHKPLHDIVPSILVLEGKNPSFRRLEAEFRPVVVIKLSRFWPKRPTDFAGPTVFRIGGFESLIIKLDMTCSGRNGIVCSADNRDR